MSGGSQTQTQNERLTPGRRTHVIYDDTRYEQVESPYGFTKLSDRMGRLSVGDHNTIEKTKYGIRLAVDQRLFAVGESTETNDYMMLKDVDMEVAAGFTEVRFYRKPAEFTGAHTGANADLPTNGGVHYEKRVKASESWDDTRFRLDEDATAFPGPDTSNNSVVLDRVMKGKLDHDPSKEFMVWVHVPTNAVHVYREHTVIYFCGPAGYNKKLRGFGQYALKVKAANRYELWERGHTEDSNYLEIGWKRRTTFGYNQPGLLGTPLGEFLRIYIRPIPIDLSDGHGHVEIKITNLGNEYGYSSDDERPLATQMSDYGHKRGYPKTDFSYRVPRVGTTNYVPTMVAPIRLDLRRDCRGAFAVSNLAYEKSATIIDDPFTMPFFPSERTNLRVESFFKTSSGSNVDFDLVEDDTGTTLTAASTEDIYGGKRKEYAFAAGNTKRAFHVRFQLTGNGRENCFLRYYRILKDGWSENLSGDEFEGGVIRHVSLMPGGSDVSQASASLTIDDPSQELAVYLADRDSVPIRIETEYDALDWTKRVILMRGYTDRPKGTRKRSDPNTTYPVFPRLSYEVPVLGLFQRLREARTPTWGFNIGRDPDVEVGEYVREKAYKVTDMLRVGLNWAGFPNAMIDIEDQPIRFFPLGSGDAGFLQPLQDLHDYLQQIARDYLGAALHFDDNYGSTGKWILIYPPRGPYANDLLFTTSGPPTVVGKKSLFTLNSYPATTVPSGSLWSSTSCQTVPITDYQNYPKRPVCNKITVVGVTAVEGGEAPCQVRRTLINPKSYNYRSDQTTADKTDIDYLGREVHLWYTDPMLNSQNAVDFIAARIYEILCRGHHMKVIHAPLVFKDHESGTGKRLFRFGDPCLLWNGLEYRQYIIRDCVPDYHHDHMQMATYELEEARV